VRAAGTARGRRKSIAGSEYIQRRSAVRVWKFETAFLARVLSESPRESARDDNLPGGREKNVRAAGKKSARLDCRGVSVTSVTLGLRCTVRHVFHDRSFVRYRISV